MKHQSRPEARQPCHCCRTCPSRRQLLCRRPGLQQLGCREVTSGRKNAPCLPTTTGGGIFRHTRHLPGRGRQKKQGTYTGRRGSASSQQPDRSEGGSQETLSAVAAMATRAGGLEFVTWQMSGLNTQHKIKSGMYNLRINKCKITLSGHVTIA